MGSSFDLEAQQAWEGEAGGRETHAMSSLQPHTTSDAIKGVDNKAQPIVPHGEGMTSTVTYHSSMYRGDFFIGSGHDIHDMNINQSQDSQTDDVNNTTRNSPSQLGESQIPAGAQSPVVPGPRNDTPVPESNEERPKIKDFDRSANELWTLYGTEAKSHDNARVNALKHNMDGVLIFVCLYLLLPIYGLWR